MREKASVTAYVGLNQVSALFPTRLAPERPAVLTLSVLVAACFSLTACGGSGPDSSTSGASAVAGHAEFSQDSSTSEREPFAGPVLSAAVASAYAEDDTVDDGTDDAAIGRSTKAVVTTASTTTALAAIAPTMSKAPTFGTGPFSQGATLVRGIGAYPGSTPIAGRRYRNNVLIPGATSASYTVVAADVGQVLVYEELAERNDTKVQKWFRSAPITVTGSAPTMTKAPTFGVGPFNPGAVLTRAVGEYPGSTAIAGRRYRNNVLIDGANAAAYTITAADAGKELVYEELAERSDTKVQKWFRSATVKVGTVIPPIDPLKPRLDTINSVETIVNDMKLLNDFVLKGYENERYGWYVGPGETHMGNNSSFTNVPEWSSFLNNPAYAGVSAKAMLPWLVIFDGVSDAASNTAVEIRNMRTYLKSRATGKWIALGGPVKSSGTYYGKPGTNLPAYDEQTAGSYDTGSMIKVPENNGYFWHGWWSAGRMAVDPADIGAIFVTVQARLAVADPGRADDRAQAQLGLQVGADYYVDTSTVYQEIAPAIGIARTKKITSNWQAFSYTTFSDVGSQIPGGGLTEAQFRAAPPPME